MSESFGSERLTLRGRLIAGVVALLALACAMIGVATYLALSRFLSGQLDGQLAAASQRFESCVDGPPGLGPRGSQISLGGSGGLGAGSSSSAPVPGSLVPGGSGPEHNPAGCANTPGQAQATFSAALSGHRITAAKVTRGSCQLSAPDRTRLARLTASGQPQTLTLSGLSGPYLMLAVRDPRGLILVSGLPVGGMASTLHDVLLTELVVFSAALLATGGLGLGWVRLSLRPLRRITATAARVAELPLASGEVDLRLRVPDADPRTEVGQLSAAFNRMLGHVESALARRQASEDRLRSFAADASHELRTPLASIRGYADLARRYPGAARPEVAAALDRVAAEAARMSTIVDDLLLLARMDAGRPIQRSDVDLSRLAVDATDDARAARPDHHWRLDLAAEPVLVTGDQDRLRQVLANLLANASTHTPAGTTVTVSLRPEPGTGPAAEAGMTEMTVTDDGPGIPPELRGEVFERFVRGDASRSRSSGGAGLGLSIVAAVVQAHGGEVTVASRPGRTRFTVRLPRAGKVSP